MTETDKAWNKLLKRIPWFHRPTETERLQKRQNHPAYLRHMIIERSDQLEADIENPKLDVSIAEMRESVDDYLYEHGILLPDAQLNTLLRELNFHRDNAEKFQVELAKSLSKLDANT